MRIWPPLAEALKDEHVIEAVQNLGQSHLILELALQIVPQQNVFQNFPMQMLSTSNLKNEM